MYTWPHNAGPIKECSDEPERTFGRPCACSTMDFEDRVTVASHAAELHRRVPFLAR